MSTNAILATSSPATSAATSPATSANSMYEAEQLQIQQEEMLQETQQAETNLNNSMNQDSQNFSAALAQISVASSGGDNQ